MREWTREEKYRYLKDPQELLPLYEKIRHSRYRQRFHNQAVTGPVPDLTNCFSRLFRLGHQSTGAAIPECSSFAAFIIAGISCFFLETTPGRINAPSSGFFPYATETSCSQSLP